MGNPLKSVPWQVQLVGFGVGASLVLGYLAWGKIKGAVGAASDATIATVKKAAESPGVALASDSHERKVLAVATDPAYSYLQLMRASLSGGAVFADAMNVRMLLMFKGAVNSRGVPGGDFRGPPEPPGLSFSIVPPPDFVAAGVNTGSVGGGW